MRLVSEKANENAKLNPRSEIDTNEIVNNAPGSISFISTEAANTSTRPLSETRHTNNYLNKKELENDNTNIELLKNYPDNSLTNSELIKEIYFHVKSSEQHLENLINVFEFMLDLNYFFSLSNNLIILEWL